MLEDLILLDLQDFDIILGLDFSASHHTKVDSYRKEVTISIANWVEFVFKGIRSFPKIIFALLAKRLARVPSLHYR